MIGIDIERRLGAFHIQVAFATEARVTALFGRSGSGKTSLVNMIAGLMRPDRGTIEIDGKRLFDSAGGVDIAAERRRVGYVFQEGRLFPHLTVRRNLLYGHALTPAAERYIHLDQVVELLGLEHLLERRPGALSGGEKQRVAIGRALLASPRLLLLDEPLAALDNFRKGEVLQYIERLRDEFRIPIIYVSHAIEEVTRLADTMVVLSQGKAVAAGPVSEIMSRLDLAPYTGRFEAGAVIAARVAAQDLDYQLTRLEFAGGQLFVANLDALVGEPVRVRIRARDVAIALQRPQQVSFLNVLSGRITQISHAEEAAVDVRIDIAGTPLLARVTRRSVDDLALAPGKEVYALVKAVSLDRHSVGYV